MSVVPHWKLLAPWRIPRRLAVVVPNARGRNDVACWRLGEQGFVAEQIGEHLQFVPDHLTHGLVEPLYAMPLEGYEGALANTQNDWVVDES